MPDGWRFAEQPGGSHRLTDADDVMSIELSFMRLPPLPPDVPGVAERVRLVVEDNEHGSRHGPIRSFHRDGVAYAWTEYPFDSSDTKRPDAPPRPARGRCLIAANDFIQVLVTGAWWEPDVALGERTWDEVIGSLRIAGRDSNATPPSVSA